MNKFSGNYRREKFAELGQSREQLEEQIKEWKDNMKSMCRKEHAELRHATIKMIQEIPNKEEKQTNMEQEPILKRC